MPHCTSCGAALTAGVRHACAAGVGSEALLKAWAHGPANDTQADSTRKSRRVDPAHRPGPVDPTLVSLVNTDHATAMTALEIEKEVAAELKADAAKKAPQVERHVLTRKTSARDSSYVEMPPVAPQPSSSSASEANHTELPPVVLRRDQVESHYVEMPPVPPAPSKLETSRSSLVSAMTSSQPHVLKREQSIHDSQYVEMPPLPPQVPPRTPLPSLPSSPSNAKSNPTSPPAVSSVPSAAAAPQPKATPAVPPKPREWRRTFQMPAPQPSISSPALPSPSRKGRDADASVSAAAAPPALTTSSSAGVLLAPAVPPKPARTVQINAPPPARQESHNKALARGTAPPGLYSRKLLEEETAKYKKEQEEANATKAAEQPAPADGMMRKWAVRYKAIEKTYTQVEAKSGSPRGNPSPRTRKAAAKPEAENSQRAKVIREIIATEEDYVRDMSLLLKLWLEPIAHKKLLDRKFEELNLSAEITLMLQVNNELLARLKTSSDVGAAILKMSAFLKLYTQYCVKESEASAIVAKCVKTEPFASFSEYTSSRPECRSLDMRSFMIKPIQRLCQYPLLLGQLKKETPPEHPEYASLCSALDLVQETVQAVNARKSELESLARMRVLAEQLRGWPDAAFRVTNSPHRRLVQEGSGQIVVLPDKDKESGGSVIAVHAPSATTEPVSWYLFNDFMAVAKAGTVIERIVGVSQEVQHVIGQFWAKDSMWRKEDTQAVQLFRKGVGVTLVLSSTKERDDLAELLKGQLQPWDDVQVIVFTQQQQGGDKKEKERRHKSTRNAPPPTSLTPVSSGKDLRSKEKDREGSRRDREHNHHRDKKEIEKDKEEKDKVAQSAVVAQAPVVTAHAHAATPPAAAPVASKRTARALYAYKAEANTEVSLKPGDTVTLLSTDSPDWWYGTTSDGRSGYFPTSYVRAD